jgi:hypothetical protein
MISTVAKARVNASRKSVSMSDLYIVSPLSGESRQALRCERDKASPRLKLASFGNLRGRTRGKFVIATIARAIMNRSSRKIKKLEDSHSQYVESALITLSNVLPARSADNGETAIVDVTLGARGYVRPPLAPRTACAAACALRHSTIGALVRLITCPTVGILQLGPASAICSPGFFYVNEAGFAKAGNRYPSPDQVQ